ncbi:uncharacterized protein ACJ7VT_001052 [Polymixia lowei]
MRISVTTKKKHKQKTMARNMSGTRKETFVWTDDEVELLLRVTLDYKSTKLQDHVDWESCHAKYSDIFDAFLAQYPKNPTDKDFPHDPNAITKSQVTAKVKNVRGKYRQAVDTGRRSGQGRVVLLFFELCEEIWCGSPATRSVDAGFETGDLEDSSSNQSSAEGLERPTDSPRSTESHGSRPPAVVKQRRDMLQAKLNSHRTERLKRRLPAETAVQEDIILKKRMLELMEESARRNAENMQQINQNIANITCAIQDGFSLMRQLLVQPQHISHPHSSRGGFGQFTHVHPPDTCRPSHTQ